MNDSIENEFFVIDSNNLGNVESNFYGYMIMDTQVVFNAEDLSGNGAYVSVVNDSDNIFISQDFCGSYGLYLFEKGDSFVFSNSFVKLEEYVKESFELSFNECFARALLSTDNASFSFDETLVNEIRMIPKNHKIKIDIPNKKYEEITKNSNIELLDLSANDVVSSLDDWFNKWINIFRTLIADSGNLSFELADDVSSFVLLALLLNSNIDLNNVSISSGANTLISGFARDYNIKVNVNPGNNIADMSIPLDFSFFTKLGFQKQYNFPSNIYDEYQFSINNRDMEFINNNIILNLEEFIENTVNNAKMYSFEYGRTIEKYLWDNIHKIQKEYKLYDVNSPDFSKKFFEETILRNMRGRDNVEAYLTGKINLNPLNDEILQNIKTKEESNIYILILARYCPELLDYTEKFTDENTLNIAAKINEKYPYQKKELELIEKTETKPSGVKTPNPVTAREIHDFLTKIFYSNAFKHTFYKYFSEDVYDNIVNFYLERNNHFYAEVYNAVGIVKVLGDIEYSMYKNFNSEIDWLKTFLRLDNGTDDFTVPIRRMLTQYLTSRIDIKNKGTSSNQIKIFDISDKSARITSPVWFINEQGRGNCVISEEGKISFKIKCINDGNLAIELRTLDVSDRDKKRFPVYIDYLSFKVDDKEYLKENTLTWHNNPIRYNKKVVDGEIIKIDVRWQPFTKISKYK